LEGQRIDGLISALRAGGYRTLGPRLKDGAIVYDDVGSAAELPRGVADEQAPGSYRLKKRGDAALFGYTVGPHSWKRFLHPPVLTLWRARRQEQGFEVEAAESQEAPRFAFLGVRACELQAIAIQDQVFLGGAHVDAAYAARRRTSFVVAVNCTQAGHTCFCASMDAGPQVLFGFDLALTELLTRPGCPFLMEIGTGEGAVLAEKLESRAATDEDLRAAETAVATATAQMGRSLETQGLKERLVASYEDPHWQEVGERCLGCANCTLVCPTCFCATVEDVTDLAGTSAERVRRWDSCFTLDFSFIHGGSIRSSRAARYRQWLVHKLATWHDQFGTPGCVGCGRCITWCPVGIDITEEARALGAAGGLKGEDHGDREL
jgi:ferredoxin